MKKNTVSLLQTLLLLIVSFLVLSCTEKKSNEELNTKPRIIVTSDGEIDDECSLVRFLLYTNEWDVEGIVTSSSQYHWQGHRWAGDDWNEPYLDAYAEVYPMLVKHDKHYPDPDYLKSVTLPGNVAAEGEMDSITAGSQHIVNVLLDSTDDRPIWLQAWGGPNTIARALKTIEEEHPDKMEYVASKIRFYFIWEQDSTYQYYIRPHWGKYNIQTIISDQFWAVAYQWNKILPEDKRTYFTGDWMTPNILEGHGTLCSLYKAHEKGSHGLSGDTDFNEGDFRSEGDSPSFIYNINTGLRSMESPGYGGWGGRFVNVRGNTWLDPVPDPNYTYPDGRYYTRTAWGRMYMRDSYPEQQDLMKEYFKPMTRWTDAMQNDFAARADWCVMSYEEANHPPVVKLDHSTDLNAKPGDVIQLSAKGTSDPDGDELSYHWWYYKEPGNYPGEIKLNNDGSRDASFKIPGDIHEEINLHIVCEVTDKGSPQLTRYRRVIVKAIPDK